jgi:hypothetical protein
VLLAHPQNVNRHSEIRRKNSFNSHIGLSVNLIKLLQNSIYFLHASTSSCTHNRKKEIKILFNNINSSITTIDLFTKLPLSHHIFGIIFLDKLFQSSNPK